MHESIPTFVFLRKEGSEGKKARRKRVGGNG